MREETERKKYCLFRQGEQFQQKCKRRRGPNSPFYGAVFGRVWENRRGEMARVDELLKYTSPELDRATERRGYNCVV